MVFCTLIFLPHILHSLFKNLIYLFLAVLGLRCCVGLSLVVVAGATLPYGGRVLLIAAASPIAEHGL